MNDSIIVKIEWPGKDRDPFKYTIPESQNQVTIKHGDARITVSRGKSEPPSVKKMLHPENVDTRDRLVVEYWCKGLPEKIFTFKMVDVINSAQVVRVNDDSGESVYEMRFRVGRPI